jgi:hypothetical protein
MIRLGQNGQTEINQTFLRRFKMDKIIASFAIFALTIIVGILVMIQGWGLEPKSWWWIIGGGVFIKFALAILEVIQKNE